MRGNDPDGDKTSGDMSDDRPQRIPASALLFATMGFLPTAVCPGAGIWLVVAGRAVYGAALITAAVVIEIGLRLWLGGLRRWTRAPG